MPGRYQTRSRKRFLLNRWTDGPQKHSKYFKNDAVGAGSIAQAPDPDFEGSVHTVAPDSCTNICVMASSRTAAIQRLVQSSGYFAFV
jgi:hypothetical protein